MMKKTLLILAAALSGVLAAGAQTGREWQDPAVNEINRLGRTAADVPAQQSARRTELHRRLELGAVRRRLRRLGQKSEPHPADLPLGRGRHPDILRILSIPGRKTTPHP